MYTVEKGIAIPPSRYGTGKCKYPWREMEIGDSFFVAGAGRSIACAAHMRGKAIGLHFASRSVEENGVKGVRIWRTA